MSNKIKSPAFPLISLLLSSLLLYACDRAPTGQEPETVATAPEVLSLSNAQVMQVLPGKNVTSGYFELHNNLPKAVELVGASSTAVRSIEMHEIVQDGDNVSMRRLSSVIVEPGSTLQFARGAKHLMLFGATDLPESIAITLKFADGRETAATFQQQRW